MTDAEFEELKKQLLEQAGQSGSATATSLLPQEPSEDWQRFKAAQTANVPTARAIPAGFESTEYAPAEQTSSDYDTVLKNLNQRAANLYSTYGTKPGSGPIPTDMDFQRAQYTAPLQGATVANVLVPSAEPKPGPDFDFAQIIKPGIQPGDPGYNDAYAAGVSHMYKQGATASSPTDIAIRNLQQFSANLGPSEGAIINLDRWRMENLPGSGPSLVTPQVQPAESVEPGTIVARPGAVTARAGQWEPSASELNDNLKGGLAGKAQTILDAAHKYNVDPRLLTSIMQLESASGSSDLATKQNNFAGNFDSANNKYMSFGSPEEGINFAAQHLREEYLNKGFTTIAQIAPKYAPPGAANDTRGTNKDWARNVGALYANLGGTQTDFGVHPQPVQPVAAFTNPNGSASPARVLAPNGAEPSAIIFHHTSGGGGPDGVRSTLAERHLGVQYIVDRDGNLVSGGGDNKSQMRPGWGAGAGLSNNNTVGVEFIAQNDGDITDAQKATAGKIAQMYPGANIFGHGEVNPGHKEANEGMSTKAAALAVRANPPAGGTQVAQALPDQTTQAPTQTAEQQYAQALQPVQLQPPGGGNLQYIQTPLGLQVVNRPVAEKKPTGDGSMTTPELYNYAQRQAQDYVRSMAQAGAPVSLEEYKKQVGQFFDAANKQNIGVEPQRLGNDDVESLSALKYGVDSISGLADAAKAVNPQEWQKFAAVVAGGKLQDINQFLTGGSDELKKYAALKEMLMGNVARGLGGQKGPMSDQDIVHVEKYMPMPTDSAAVAEYKANMLKQQSLTMIRDKLKYARAAHFDTEAFDRDYDRMAANYRASTQNSNGDTPSQSAVRKASTQSSILSKTRGG